MSNKKEKLDSIYLHTAEQFAQMSESKKLKVGAIAVKDGRIISTGWNGTPSGWHHNCCEEMKYKYPEGFESPDELYANGYEPLNDGTNRWGKLVTHPEVLHAEMNMLCKVAKSTDSLDGADIYCTHSPCPTCAKLLAQSGINSFTYITDYHDDFGRDILSKLGIEVNKLSL
jgi:dCMP deaminase